MAKRIKCRRKRKIRGNGKPYVLGNKVYFDKKQIGSGVVKRLLSRLLNSVGEIIGIQINGIHKKNDKQKKKKIRQKKKNR